MDAPGVSFYEHVTVGGLPTIRLTSLELARIMLHDCLIARHEKRLPKLVFSSNALGVSLAGRNSEFRKLMQEADIIHADGMSVVFASRLLLRRSLPERIATTDFFHEAAKAGAHNGLRFYLLGGREKVNALAFARAKALYPEIQWVGRSHGYFEKNQEQALCENIVATKPDVLWVGLGRPEQETFCVLNRERLAGIGWIKTCGGLFDFLAGVNKRAPAWMQRTGLEWVWRIIQEPKRLAWRSTSTTLDAVWRLALFSREK